MKSFNPSDSASRFLIHAVRQLGENLGMEALAMKRVVHAGYYPQFRRIDGQKRQQIIIKFRDWEVIFNQNALELLEPIYEIEERLVHSIANSSGRPAPPLEQFRSSSYAQDRLKGNHSEGDNFLPILQALRENHRALDRLLRATHQRVTRYRSEAFIDTARLYEFCGEVEKIALYAQYLSLILLRPKGEKIKVLEPQFLGVNWSEVESFAENWSQVIDAEIVTDPEAEPPDFPHYQPYHSPYESPYDAPKPDNSHRNASSFSNLRGGTADRTAATAAYSNPNIQEPFNPSALPQILPPRHEQQPPHGRPPTGQRLAKLRGGY